MRVGTTIGIGLASVAVLAAIAGSVGHGEATTVGRRLSVTVMPADWSGDTMTVRVPARPGRYAVLVEGDAPTPPGPVDPPLPPGPPVPPDPPQPAPNDPVIRDVRAALPKTPAPADREAATALAGLYTELAGAVRDERFKTVYDFLGTYRKVSENMVPGDVILAARKVAAGLVAQTFPQDPETTLDKTTRDRAADLFGKLAAAFGGWK